MHHKTLTIHGEVLSVGIECYDGAQFPLLLRPVDELGNHTVPVIDDALTDVLKHHTLRQQIVPIVVQEVGNLLTTIEQSAIGNGHGTISVPVIPDTHTGAIDIDVAIEPVQLGNHGGEVVAVLTIAPYSPTVAYTLYDHAAVVDLLFGHIVIEQHTIALIRHQERCVLAVGSGALDVELQVVLGREASQVVGQAHIKVL